MRIIVKVTESHFVLEGVEMSKISENQQNKRISILDAAYELFTSKSFKNTSIDDVVKKAGIAKGTFYLYFKDKHDLMDRLIIRKSAVVFDDALSKLNEKKKNEQLDFSQQIIFVAEYIIDFMQANKEIIVLVQKKLSSCFSLFSQSSDFEGLRSEINSFLNENTVNGFSLEETKKRVYLIMELISSVCYDSIIYESPFRIDEIKPFLFSSIEKIMI